MSGKTIKVSQQVYDRLMSIKARNGHSTMDSVIRYLLYRSGEELREGSKERLGEVRRRSE